MQKRKALTTSSLKARSLSDLRKLQQHASKLAGRSVGGDQADTGAAGRTGTSASQSSRRRAHRFIPPGTGPVRPRASDGGKAALASARGGASAAASPSSVPVTPSDPVASPGAMGTQSSPEPLPESPELTLDDADIALFRRVVESVARSAPDNRVQLPPVPPAPAAQLKQRRLHAMGKPASVASKVSDHYAPAQLDQDDTAFLRAGHGPDLVKGLRRGKWLPGASLDLHGSTLDDARDRLDRFIQSCREHQIRCVRIVHGKGYGSKGGDPVLKETVRRWLGQLDAVQAWVESDEANGGAGAVLVLLEKQKA